MNPAAVLLVASLLVAAAPARKEEDDAKRLQGTWKGVSAQIDGKEREDATDLVLTVEKDTLTLKAGDKVVLKGTLKLDPTKTPRAIDVALTEGEGNAKGKEPLGIYAIDKDSFKWCLAWPGQKDRPKEFMTRENDLHTLIMFKREKP